MDTSTRLWGRVVTVDGATAEGFLRWDRNEAGAADLLDGLREITAEGLEARREIAAADPADRRRSVEILGYRVTWQEDEDFDTVVESGIRFGWLDRMVPDGDSAALYLRTGEVIRLQGNSTDLGPGMRGVGVETIEGELSTVRWSRIREVEFLNPPAGVSSASRRLHGTVTTRSGLTFTGWIAWDADEVFADEVLEGDDAAVAFRDISRVERSRERGRVTLVLGGERMVSGRMDVERGDRGIDVSDPGLGRVRIEWADFDGLELHDPRDSPLAFDRGGRLTGRVTAESGSNYEGRVLWDLDEGFGWQFLNGYVDGVDVDIEFSRIARIEKGRGGDGAQVLLRDGRTFLLEGSNDVDASNRGILIIDGQGERHFVDWAGFSALDLEVR